MEKPIQIPVRADDPPHLLLWSLDEMGPIGVGLTFGIMMEQAFLFTMIGMGVAYIYSRFRDNYPDGFFFQYAYSRGIWSIPSKEKGKTTNSRIAPNPFIKRFLP